MPDRPSDLARHLARDAEAVCRRYLPAGRREGRWWRVGDLGGAPGRSLRVRLSGPESGPAAAGKWVDAATGEHGDLLDLIAATRGLDRWTDLRDEALRFLGEPGPDLPPGTRRRGPPDPTAMARRLFAAAGPLPGTLGAAYLRVRGIADLAGCQALRLHPACRYVAGSDDPWPPARDRWPALLAAVTAPDGTVTGVHRTWLDPATAGKAPVATPRRSLGRVHGHGVRLGRPSDVLAAGEGLETVLSLRQALPGLPAIAALSSGHLPALLLPPTLRRLYAIADADPAGRHAAATLVERARAKGIDARILRPTLGDLNDDLRQLGTAHLLAGLRAQLAPDDAERFAVGR